MFKVNSKGTRTTPLVHLILVFLLLITDVVSVYLYGCVSLLAPECACGAITYSVKETRQQLGQWGGFWRQWGWVVDKI